MSWGINERMEFRMDRKAALILSGCFAVAAILTCVLANRSGRAERLSVVAVYEEDGMKAQRAPVACQYPFRPAWAGAPAISEEATVRFFHDRQHLRVAAAMIDSDLVQESDDNNRHHYLSGDVLEVFIRPADLQCYWEIFVTPNERTSVFFYPSAGRRLPGCLQKKTLDGLTFSVKLHGTLNMYQDRDNGWECEVTIPFEALEKQSEHKFDFTKPWEVQVSRYNYSAYLEKTECSQLGIATGRLDYHDFSSWVLLTFE